MSFIVAIDGPAGSGKGTIANRIANELNLVNIDTGATYRCLALAVLRANVEIDDTENILKVFDSISIEIQGTNDEQTIVLNNEDVTQKIRSFEVTQVVSQISAIPEVRLRLVEFQRMLANNKNVIMDGRDIGTYVFPNADVKIYLDASLEERAKRRYEENQQKGIEATYEEVLENIRMRDRQDKAKEIGALKIAEDAIYIDSTNMTIDEVANEVKKIIIHKAKENEA